MEGVKDEGVKHPKMTRRKNFYNLIQITSNDFINYLHVNLVRIHSGLSLLA